MIYKLLYARYLCQVYLSLLSGTRYSNKQERFLKNQECVVKDGIAATSAVYFGNYYIELLAFNSLAVERYLIPLITVLILVHVILGIM